jgi:hypothetical protein
MNIRRFARKFPYSTIALALMSAGPLTALAQDSHSQMPTSQTNELTPDQKSKASALLGKVREATERFRNVEVAEAAGYELQFGCVSGDSAGAMGLHYVNFGLIKADVDLKHPPIVIYEPTPDGRLRLTGADYIIFADGWDATHPPGNPPQLMGQTFHLFDAPNRFRLKAFYTLHVWAWKDNPNGAFVNWHPNVSCESFTGKDD